MKKILIAIPALLALSGCTGLVKNATTFKYECAKLEKPYINESLREKFNNSKTAYIETTYNGPCITNGTCFRMKNNERWDRIKLNLAGRSGLFPEKKGFYTIYRDYEFKNCINDLTGGFSENKYQKNGKNFCLSSLENDTSSYNVKMEEKSQDIYNDNGISIHKNLYKVKVDGETFVEVEGVAFNSQSTHEVCGINNKAYQIILNNF